MSVACVRLFGGCLVEVRTHTIVRKKKKRNLLTIWYFQVVGWCPITTGGFVMFGKIPTCTSAFEQKKIVNCLIMFALWLQLCWLFRSLKRLKMLKCLALKTACCCQGGWLLNPNCNCGNTYLFGRQLFLAWLLSLLPQRCCNLPISKTCIFNQSDTQRVISNAMNAEASDDVSWHPLCNCKRKQR